MTLPNSFFLKGRYQILDVLGEGGMGVVYKARDLLKNRDCAIKHLLFEQLPQKTKATQRFIGANDTETLPDIKPTQLTNEQFKRLFKREATLLSQFKHPNLPEIFDYIEDERWGVFIVMEIIIGREIHQIPLKETEIYELMSQVMAALTSCHEQRIAHLDIKPENILVTDTQKAYLIDFGLARQFNMPDDHKWIGVAHGYSPPEQYVPQAWFSQTIDIYALGATLYHLVIGQSPPDSRLLEQKMARLPPYDPGFIHCSEATYKVILKAMQLNAQDRYQAVADMQHALEVACMPVSITPVLKRFDAFNTQAKRQLQATSIYRIESASVVSITILLAGLSFLFVPIANLWLGCLLLGILAETGIVATSFKDRNLQLQQRDLLLYEAVAQFKNLLPVLQTKLLRAAEHRLAIVKASAKFDPNITEWYLACIAWAEKLTNTTAFEKQNQAFEKNIKQMEELSVYLTRIELSDSTIKQHIADIDRQVKFIEKKLQER